MPNEILAPAAALREEIPLCCGCILVRYPHKTNYEVLEEELEKMALEDEEETGKPPTPRWRKAFRPRKKRKDLVQNLPATRQQSSPPGSAEEYRKATLDRLVSELSALPGNKGGHVGPDKSSAEGMSIPVFGSGDRQTSGKKPPKHQESIFGGQIPEDAAASDLIPVKYGPSDRLATICGIPLALATYMYSSVILGWAMLDIFYFGIAYDDNWTYINLGALLFGAFKLLYALCGFVGNSLGHVFWIYLASQCLKALLFALVVEVVLEWIGVIVELLGGVPLSESLVEIFIDTGVMILNSVLAYLFVYGMFTSLNAVFVVGGTGWEKLNWAQVMLKKEEFQWVVEPSSMGSDKRSFESTSSDGKLSGVEEEEEEGEHDDQEDLRDDWRRASLTGAPALHSAAGGQLRHQDTAPSSDEVMRLV